MQDRIRKFLDERSPNFQFKDVEVFGEKAILINPNHSDGDWTNDNLIFRSLLVTPDGEVISSGFKKFFNFGQSPNIEPMPSGPVTFMEKLDGSLLIISKRDDNIICRTRGTVDATQMENGYEIEVFKSKYPAVFDKHALLEGLSYLYEWTTPTNEIVLKCDEPELALVGVVVHNNLSYFTQDDLDRMAPSFGVDRPQRFEFSSLTDAAEEVKTWENAEGVVGYSEGGQIMKKVKSEWYNRLHYFKTGFRSIKKIVELWESLGCPVGEQKFFEAVCNEYDYEIAKAISEQIELISDHAQKITDKYEYIKRLIKKQPNDRKTRAIWIQTHDELFQKLAFLELSGKELNNETFKRIMLGVIRDSETGGD